MKFLVLVTAVLVFYSCNNQSDIGKKLSSGDSLVIDFTDTITGAISKTVAATDVNAINKLSRFIDGKESEIFKCGYDGNLRFYSKGAIKGEVSFKYTNPGCRHFLFEENGKLSATQMSNEAADFLKDLAVKP